MPATLVYCIGFLAQGFFSARILVQWILSEKARKVLSPTVFWILSLAGSYLLGIYGFLRDDFAVVLGQFISYYVYIYNLKLKGVWRTTPSLLRWALLLTPAAFLLWCAFNFHEVYQSFFQNSDVPLWLLLFGSAGQIVFTLRFIYQWYISSRAGVSELPAGFWWISLTGSMTIVAYAIVRHDPVLILGQSFGFVSYVRNLMIGYRQRHAERRNKTARSNVIISESPSANIKNEHPL